MKNEIFIAKEEKVQTFCVPLRRNPRPDGGIGRHEGLKIPWPVMAVRVRFPFRAPNTVIYSQTN